PIFKDRVAMVIGSGNSALNSVIDLLPFASKIYVLTHGDAMRGDAVLQEEIKNNPKVEIIFNATVSGLEGDLMIKAIKYKDGVSQEEKRLEVFGAFVNIGMKPNSELVKDLVQLNENGEIVTDFLGRTSQFGIWAAGDITSLPYKQISIAIGDGIRAALDVYAEVKKTKNKDAI
ncbi:MAG TPA: FAD-dependent oxidoreductase, partial [Candidatus Paceibacterota bacterium]|nr:FAD-dependent oxidoreductase [Candidatus Paceibacterota bacterium]